MKLFLIEDDDSLRRELTQLLTLNDYEVESCEDFTDAARIALETHPDCVLLDLSLPGTSGHVICREIRAQSTVPIMVITSSESEFDEVLSMNIGADDYIVKPYSPAVLLAHIASILRRSMSTESPVLVHKEVKLDIGAASVSYHGKTSELTRNELKILAKLMREPGCVITRQEIMCSLWDSDEFIDDNTLTVNINRLRKKLEALGVPKEFLVTRRGQGYSV